MNNKRKIIILVIAIIGLIGVTIGVTYAYLSYVKEGERESSISTGAITFHYQESSNRTVNISEALPINDNQGKGQTNYFDFTITSTKPSGIEIPYQITARKLGNSENRLSDENIKVYLTKVTLDNNNDEVEQQVLLSKYSDLIVVEYNNYDDEILWTDSVEANVTDYTQKYRLRMWIDESTDFSPEIDPLTGQYREVNGEYVYPNNGKTFSVQINVYGGEAKQPEPDAPEISNMAITGQTVEQVLDNSVGYDYVTNSLPMETTSTTLNITTEDVNDTVTVENITTALEVKQESIRRLSNVVPITLDNLRGGNNDFRITIKGKSRKTTSIVVRVVVTKSNVATLSGLNITNCPINETFDSETTSYSCTTSDSSLLISAAKTNQYASYVVNGNQNFSKGNNSVTINVTAEDGVTTKIYTISVVKVINYVSVTGDSIIQILENNDLGEGYYNFNINNKTEQYKVHLVISENNIISTDTKFGDNDDVSTTIDGTRQFAQNMVIVKVNGDLTNNAKIEPYYDTSTGYGGPKGFMLYVTGTLTNNGTIDNKHGAYSDGEDIYLYKNADDSYEKVPSLGSSGGSSANNAAGNEGRPGSEYNSRATGGGGSGGSFRSGTSGAGGRGTSYSGGAGGGGIYFGRVIGRAVTDGSSNGGIGGQAGSDYSGGGGAGAGNPGGIGGSGSADGTGGLLIIYANSIENNNIITADGTNGKYADYYGFGGSSGGGSINIFYKNSYINTSDITANGGGVVGSSAPGGKGGNGTVNVGSISTGTYVSN